MKGEKIERESKKKGGESLSQWQYRLPFRLAIQFGNRDWYYGLAKQTGSKTSWYIDRFIISTNINKYLLSAQCSIALVS